MWCAKRGIDSHLPLYRAVCKYGWDAFVSTVLSVHSDRVAASLEEIRQISLRGTRSPDKGYNVTSGGEGSPARFCKHGHDKELVGSYRGSCKACRQDSDVRRRADPVKRAKENAQYALIRRRKRLTDPEYLRKEREGVRARYRRDPSAVIARVEAWRKAKKAKKLA
jgi:hypothetical protein